MLNSFSITEKKNLKKVKPIKIYTSPVKKTSTINFAKTENKDKLYDRFLPYSISPNFNCDSPSYTKSPTKNKNSTQYIKNSSKKDNYQRVLLANLISDNDSSSINLTKDPQKNLCLLDIKNSKRKVSYSKKRKSTSKNNTNPILNNSFTQNHNLLLTSSKNKINIIKPYKNINFGDINEISEKIPDNYYYNVLDMYNISSILISTEEGGTSLIDFSKEKYKITNFNRNPKNKNENNNYYNSPLILCNKFVSNSNNYFISSNSKCDLLFTDIIKNNTIKILSKYYTASYTFDITDNLIYMGEENGKIELLDMRESHYNGKNVYFLYSHPGKNEICKILYSKINDFVISGGNDDTGIIYDFRNNKILKKINHQGAIKALTFNKNQNYLLSGGGNKDKMLKLWDLKKLNLISETKTESQITGVEFLNDNFVFTSFGFNDNMSVIYKLNLNKIFSDNISEDQLCDMNTSYDVKNEMNKKIDIFDREEIYEEHTKRILYTAKDRLNQYIATGSENEIKIFKIHKYNRDKMDLEEEFNFH